MLGPFNAGINLYKFRTLLADNEKQSFVILFNRNTGDFFALRHPSKRPPTVDEGNQLKKDHVSAAVDEWATLWMTSSQEGKRQLCFVDEPCSHGQKMVDTFNAMSGEKKECTDQPKKNSYPPLSYLFPEAYKQPSANPVTQDSKKPRVSRPPTPHPQHR